MLDQGVWAEVKIGGEHLRLFSEQSALGVQASVYNVNAKNWIAPSEPADDIEQGKDRAAEHARTGRKIPVSVIREEIHVPPREGPPYDGKDWGMYVFGAWLEEDIKEPGDYYISFPYWRNGRFAGQYTLRAEPQIIRDLFKQMESRGWFARGS